MLRAGQDPCFQSALCFQSRTMHSMILFYESLPLNSFPFSSCTLLADIQKYTAIMQEVFGALQGGEMPMQLSEIPLLGSILIMLREIRDETELQPSGQSQCSKTSSVGLVAKLTILVFIC